jgi:hypothetical protein
MNTAETCHMPRFSDKFVKHNPTDIPTSSLIYHMVLLISDMNAPRHWLHKFFHQLAMCVGRWNNYLLLLKKSVPFKHC